MQRACRYCLDFYNPNLNKKMSARGGKNTYPGSWAAWQKGEDRISVPHPTFLQIHGEKICPFTNSRVHWQDCRHQIPQPHMSGFKTSSNSFKPFLSPTLENTELTYSVSVSGSSSNSPTRPPESMAPLFSPTLTTSIFHIERENWIFTRFSPTSNFPFVSKDKFNTTLC